MEKTAVVFSCLLICSCKSQLYSGFQSPFLSRLYPPSTVHRAPPKFEAAYQQPNLVLCQHPTFPNFDSPFNNYPLNNPCPSIDTEYLPTSGKTAKMIRTTPVPREKSSSHPSITMTEEESSTEPIEMVTSSTTTSINVAISSEAPVRKYFEIVSSKCKEYSDMAIEKFHASSMLLNSVFTTVTLDTCDISAGLITGGIEANPREFPHMAAIAYKDERGDVAFGCGGSLISDWFVLTAAHCECRNDVDPAVMVRLGSLSLGPNKGNDYKIEVFIPHEKYDFFTKQNDIAVIKLADRVNFVDPKAVRPACLWQSEKLDAVKAIATGYGAKRHGGEMNTDLMKVRLDILDNDVCVNYFNEDDDEDDPESNVVINDNQMCIGSHESGKDTCQGDSGGPVQITVANETCVSHIIGVTSFGSSVCGGDNTTAVYTRVSAYIDWIVSKVWD